MAPGRAGQPRSPDSTIWGMVRLAGHVVGEGLKGLLVSPGQVLACIASLFVASCLVTVFASVGGGLVSALERAAGRARVIAYLKQEVPEEHVTSLMERLRRVPGVSGVEYLSAEQDRSRNAELLPEDLVRRLPPDAIPGQHCLEISLGNDPGVVPDVHGLLGLLRDDPDVDVAAGPPVGADRLRAAAAAVSLGRTIFTLMAVLLLVSTVFFVVGTLTRTMESRREELVILRLVGATSAFVKVPLFVQGVVQGLAGVLPGALAGIVLLGLLESHLAMDLAVAPAIGISPEAVLGPAAAVGALIGAAGALIATSRRLP